MNSILKKFVTIAVGIFSFLLTLMPEKIFEYTEVSDKLSNELNIVINRIILFVIVYFLSFVILGLCSYVKWWKTIKEKNILL